MDFEINEVVLFKGHKAKILGWEERQHKYVIHRFEEEVGWSHSNLVLYDKKGKRVNKYLRDLSHLWYVNEKFIKKLNSEIVDEAKLEKEDTTMEKLILKKLIKMQKNYE